MTIKDIARIADVSPSTVSKIMNGKHSNISEKTRERVLTAIKEHNYTPYASALAANTGKTFLIGVLLSAGEKNYEMLDGIFLQACEDGYGVVVCVSEGADDELKNVSALLARRVDGILWQQSGNANLQAEKNLSKRNIPFFTLNPALPSSAKNLCMDFRKAGYIATETLMKSKHKRTACIRPDGGSDTEAFQKGYEQCLYDYRILGNDKHSILWNGDPSAFDQPLISCTGFICFNTDIASELEYHAERKNYYVPRDISVVSLRHTGSNHSSHQSSSVLPLPYTDFGRYCCKMLITKIEKKSPPRSSYGTMQVSDGGVDVPITVRGKKIVVVGAMNMDTLINVGHTSGAGGTLAAKSYNAVPGGRGINQAVGAAKLGAEVYLIGRRGIDYEGNSLNDALLEHRIDISCVKSDPQSATGRAYIHIQENGESTIVVYDGANENLSPRDIESADEAFRNASYCLLQSDVRLDTVLCAARRAKEYGAHVLLKPGFHSEPDGYNELLRNVDIFLPNLEELDKLCPWEGTPEEKAQHFRNQGVGTVIITLSERGCYLLDSKHSEYFPAGDFKAVDTTGAGDAFASALAVYLADGHDITSAIRYANCAAGFSITRQGVSPALVDKVTLEAYMSNL